MTPIRLRSAALAGSAAIAMTGLVGPVGPAQAALPIVDRDRECVESPHDQAVGARGVDGSRALDHRDISAREKRAIEARTDRILADQEITQGEANAAAAAASIPVYVHVMRDSRGGGDVANARINEQVAVLNKTYGGQESANAAVTGFTFTLAGIDRYNNTKWHQDRQSSTYRSQTRQGGANALNIWLVDFDYLGVATFPWDYSRSPGIDGVRVQYTSLPGGSATNYNLGETATHEAGHWLGLYHTFQGGCTPTNDEVSDTAAQSSPTNGCPTGRDSCSLPGLDPIHNYMDYSYDSCYNQFSGGQSSRMASMFSAYRS
jgi:hypothetical protein